jgi:hypothetical protein
MPDDMVYQLPAHVDRDIRHSFTGGATDVYLPHNRSAGFLSNLFDTLYYYDVNSLYPFIMAKTLMPIGIPMAFEGDIRLIDPKAYGYFFCDITCPDDIKNPILQRRVETSDGVRTIAGTGTWQGWIYSKEMDNAILNGYSFNIIKGYEFKKGDIFSGYVETMYNLRLQYPKDHPMNLIAKLLMNSLYGV